MYKDLKFVLKKKFKILFSFNFYFCIYCIIEFCIQNNLIYIDLINNMNKFRLTVVTEIYLLYDRIIVYKIHEKKNQNERHYLHILIRSHEKNLQICD